MQHTADALDGDIAGGALEGGARREHLALAGALQIAVKLFVEGHSAEHGVLGAVVRRLWGDLHFKRSSGVPGGKIAHDSLLLRPGRSLGMRAEPDGEAYGGCNDEDGCGARVGVHGCSEARALI